MILALVKHSNKDNKVHVSLSTSFMMNDSVLEECGDTG